MDVEAMDTDIGSDNHLHVFDGLEGYVEMATDDMSAQREPKEQRKRMKEDLELEDGIRTYLIEREQYFLQEYEEMDWLRFFEDRTASRARRVVRAEDYESYYSGHRERTEKQWRQTQRLRFLAIFDKEHRAKGEGENKMAPLSQQILGLSYFGPVQCRGDVCFDVSMTQSRIWRDKSLISMVYGLNFKTLEAIVAQKPEELISILNISAQMRMVFKPKRLPRAFHSAFDEVVDVLRSKGRARREAEEATSRFWDIQKPLMDRLWDQSMQEFQSGRAEWLQTLLPFGTYRQAAVNSLIMRKAL